MAKKKEKKPFVLEKSACPGGGEKEPREKGRRRPFNIVVKGNGFVSRGTQFRGDREGGKMTVVGVEKKENLYIHHY